MVGLENVFRDGPIIFVGNYSNLLIDLMFIVIICECQVYFVVKDVFFKSCFFFFFLKLLGCVFVFCKMDHAVGTDNCAIFKVFYEVLVGGGVMGIFLEGISYDDAQFVELKMGVVWIVLGKLVQYFE